MASNYDSSYDPTDESESEVTDKSYLVETDSEEEAPNSYSYSSGAFQNADYGNLDYDTGDDIQDPAFVISMSTRSETGEKSSLPSAAKEGHESTRKRSRARLGDPDPLDLSKRRRTGGVKGKGPAKARPHPPLPPATSSKSTLPPPLKSTVPPSTPTVDTQQALEPMGEPTMPTIDSHLPPRKTSFKEWVDKLLSRYVFSL
jgi:hypothetical protein